MARREDFDTSVALPPGLTIAGIQRAVDYIERELVDLAEIYFEQANVFSALVGIFGIKALDSNTIYEKSPHKYTAQQRFPDLRRRGSPTPTPPNEARESKASKRIWDLQSHYDHPGWYIVWRYLVDPTTSLEPAKPVIIWRVDVVFLGKGDWTYQGSSASAGGGGRSHTFGLKYPHQKLRGRAAYRRSDVTVAGGRAIPANGHS